MDQSEFAKRLKYIREKNNISLSQLAEDIGIAKSALSRYENGKMEPGLKIMIKITDYFNVSLDWLSGNGEMNKIRYKEKESYNEAIDICIEQNITPEKIVKLIELIKE